MQWHANHTKAEEKKQNTQTSIKLKNRPKNDSHKPFRLLLLLLSELDCLFCLFFYKLFAFFSWLYTLLAFECVYVIERERDSVCMV